MLEAAGNPTLAERARQVLPSPPQEGESDAARLSRLLDVVLALSASVTAAFLLLTWPVMDGRARVLTASLLATLAGLAYLSRLGFTRSAATAYLASVWLFVTLALCLFGAWRTPAASAYAWWRSRPPCCSGSGEPRR